MSIVLVVIIRSIIAFFVLLFLVRLLGKQQVSQLTFFDYVVGITIGSIAATLSVQVNENTTATLAGLVTWAALALLLAVLGIHNVWVRKVSDGEPTVVVENGKIMDKNLKKIRIPTDELLSELRTKGVFSIADVEFATFEPGGKISVQKKSQKQPVTPSDLNIPSQYDGLPTNLIMDGVVIEEALHSLKLTKAWLYYQLGKQNISDTSEISLAQLDTKGYLYVDLKGDKPYYTIPTMN
ncbi:MAG: DUF421 domain-containing protein [Desulfotomaculaceae bacterium]|nr:DUF421 domain-containing protein [Desulfotomaculaceae bacterium]